MLTLVETGFNLGGCSWLLTHDEKIFDQWKLVSSRGLHIQNLLFGLLGLPQSHVRVREPREADPPHPWFSSLINFLPSPNNTIAPACIIQLYRQKEPALIRGTLLRPKVRRVTRERESTEGFSNIINKIMSSLRLASISTTCDCWFRVFYQGPGA